MSVSAHSREARVPAASKEPDLGELTHELANLVQALSGNIELASARTIDEQVLRYLANARAAAQQLEDLTRALQGKR